MQTVPTLAILALMIPIFGVGKTPAIVALFIYVLLPNGKCWYRLKYTCNSQYNIRRTFCF
jgi:ABC-type phosphate/phosphonate transport system permease subunit